MDRQMNSEGVKWKWYENALIYLITASLLALVGQVIGAVLVMLPAGAALGYTGLTVFGEGKAAMPPLMETVTMYLVPVGTWIALLLHFCWKRNRPLFRCFTSFCRGNTARNFFLGLLIGAGMNGACILAAYLHGDITLSFASFRVPEFLLILFCVFIQSSSEELLCRGYLYQKLARRYGGVAAVAGNALFFAFLHLGNPGINAPAFVDLILSGLVFSLMVHYMDSMWCAFAAHTAWNYTQNIIFGLPNSGLRVPVSMFRLNEGTAADSIFYNTGFGIEGTWFAVAVEVCVVAVLLVRGRREHRKPTNIWGEKDAGREEK